MTYREHRRVSFIDIIGKVWCRVTHDAPMLPIHGEYECRICMRRFPVPWAAASLKTTSRTGQTPVFNRRFVPVYQPTKIQE